MPDSHTATLASLPPELIDQILSFLSPYDLISVSTTVRKLYQHSQNDRLWQNFVQGKVAVELTTPRPCESFKELFIQHYPRWFLTQHKIWYSDYMHGGRLLLARFNPLEGCIEAYTVAAERGPFIRGTLDWDGQVNFHTFNPKVQLDLNQPIIKLPLNKDPKRSTKFVSELPMPHSTSLSRIASTFTHTRFLPDGLASWSRAAWPPLTLPSPGNQRTRNESSSAFHSLGHRPAKLSEVSDATFRIRQWIEFQHSWPRHGGPSRTSEIVHTYATLPEECYTPTKEKPWQGIWCGDYSGHGCEFLVITQSDSSQPLPEKARRAFAIWPHSDVDAYGGGTSDDEEDEEDEGDYDIHRLGVAPTNAAAARRFLRSRPNTIEPSPNDVAPYKGRLIATKLTGDPNVPRGEITFIAEDLGARGLVGFAPEPLFNEEYDDAAPFRPVRPTKPNDTVGVGPSGSAASRVGPRSTSSSSTRSDCSVKLTPCTSTDSVASAYQPDARGARIVKAVGQIANSGYVDDDYIPSQMIIVSENTIAQYWRPYGYVSFYKRVNLSPFLKPEV